MSPTTSRPAASRCPAPLTHSFTLPPTGADQRTGTRCPDNRLQGYCQNADLAVLIGPDSIRSGFITWLGKRDSPLFTTALQGQPNLSIEVFGGARD